MKDKDITVEKVMEKGDEAINRTVRNALAPRIGVLDAGFLSQSVGLLNTPPAVCLRESESVQLAIDKMRDRHIGCVLVVDDYGKLRGIFSERDIMQKIISTDVDCKIEPLAEYMTQNPVTIDFTVSIAFALSLMSMGGFRHLPVVDPDMMPVGVISVKDIVQRITDTFMQDIMSFEEGEE